MKVARLSRTAIGTTLIGLVATAIAATGGPAVSAVDTMPPTLTSPVKASFVVGTQIGLGTVQGCGEDPHDLRLSVAAAFTWRGADDSGDVRYRLTQSRGYDGTTQVFNNSTRTAYTGGSGNTDQACGGGSHTVYEWDLTAKDAAGNTTTNKVYGGRMRLTQDDNRGDHADYATQPTIAYQGSWGRSTCACWSDGGVHRTTAKGASVTIVPQYFTSYPSYATNHHVGLVMEKGPNRGRFQVLVDGELRKTVDLYASTSQPRTVVWQTAFLDYGHTVTLVNLATPGRPRIDLDAVLTN